MTKSKVERIILKRIMIIESIVNTIIGMVITFLSQLIIYPLFGLNVSISQNIAILFIFTAISFIRNFAIRYIFSNIKRAIKNNISLVKKETFNEHT